MWEFIFHRCRHAVAKGCPGIPEFLSRGVHAVLPSARSSSQMIRPLPLSSYMARASAAGAGVGAGVAIAVEVSAVVGISTTIAVEVQPSNTVSMVRLGLVYGGPAFQAGLDDAVHLGALFQVLEPLGGVPVGFLMTVDAGGGGMRFRGSDANSERLSELAAHRSMSLGRLFAALETVGFSGPGLRVPLE